jgi:hypothetical protein
MMADTFFKCTTRQIWQFKKLKQQFLSHFEDEKIYNFLQELQKDF